MNNRVNIETSETCRSANAYVVLFLVIPGMNNVAVGCAMLIGRLVQETIQRALASQELLVAEPPSSWAIVAAMRKEIVASGVAGSDLSDGADAPNQFTRNVASRLYDEPSLSFVRHEDEFYFAFPVSNFENGLTSVEVETKRLGFLELAEIGRYDSGEDLCRAHHPKNAALPLTRHCVDVLKGAGLLAP